MSTFDIPVIGLGTYKSTPDELKVAIPEAIKCGYRLFDTATVYRNEEAVGKLLKEQMNQHNINRNEIFVTSKLAPADQGYEKALAAVDESLKKLNLEYIDLYLIHWPGTSKLDPSDPRNATNRRESWRALEESVRSGKLKFIGVSNYNLRHLKEMEQYSTIKPFLNQFELHPAHVPSDVIDYCERNGIFVQTYASLAEGVLLEHEFLAQNSEIPQMAAKYNCSIAQLLLKWPLQRGWGIIPKSINPARIRENISLNHFKIDENDMAMLDNFHKKVSFKKCWNPDSIL